MKNLCVERSINASLESAWKVVSDVDNYARYAPNLHTSRIVSGKGIGLIRECTSKEGNWTEICTDWKNQESYCFQVQTQAKDYPFPFKTLNAKWEVYENVNAQAVMRMEFEVEFKNVVIGWLVYPLMKKKFLLVCEQLLDNWQQEILAP
jgi:ribosome-associated toxin RatA of RatAB toxin-antitoxin module